VDEVENVDGDADLNAWQSQAAFLCGIFKRFAALSFMYLFQEPFPALARKLSVLNWLLEYCLNKGSSYF